MGHLQEIGLIGSESIPIFTFLHTLFGKPKRVCAARSAGTLSAANNLDEFLKNIKNRPFTVSAILPS